jgi:hypothetical protein
VIVVTENDRLRLIRQVDHQAQCGLIARAWGNDAFFRPGSYDALLDVAECHDEGWRHQDALPEIDAHGIPVNFADLDRVIHAPMYELGISEAVVRGARVGLLASMHGQGLYEKRMGLDGPTPPRDARPVYELAFLRDQERLQAELRAHLSDDQDLTTWTWDAYRILQAWDVLSLYLCWYGLLRAETWTLPQVPRCAGDPGVTLTVRSHDARSCSVDPWPFAADAVDATVATCRIPNRRYGSPAEIAGAMQDAGDEELPLALRPA